MQHDRNDVGPILVADDDPLQIEIITTVLRQQGVSTVASALGGQEALANLKQPGASYAAIFLDLQMPVMDGIGVMRELVRTKCPSPIILCSGEDNSILQAAESFANQSGLRVAGVLSKPVTPEQVSICLSALKQGAQGSNPLPQVSTEELQRALQQQELLLHFQPKVKVGSLQPVGAEALVRWNHPKHGMIPPASFIPLAEETGLIDLLTEQVLNMAVESLARWQQADFSITLSVNLSMDNLHDEALTDRLVRALQRRGLSPASIVLELTESRLMQSNATPLGILTQVRLAGFGLSIDDFGTGFSSLEQLRKLPFTELKLDRAFVHDAHRDTRRHAILEASLTMAKKIGLKTVAEGVENEDDAALVTSLGCDLLQGYHIARPLPASDFERWLTSRL